MRRLVAVLLVVVLMLGVATPAYGVSVVEVSNQQVLTYYQHLVDALADYKGLNLETATVGEVEAATGLKASQVATLSRRLKLRAQSAGVSPKALSGASGLFAGIAIVYALDVGAQAVLDGVLGKVHYYDNSGQEVSSPSLSGGYAWTEGGLWPEDFPAELAYLLPGFELEIPGEGYVPAVQGPYAYAPPAGLPGTFIPPPWDDAHPSTLSHSWPWSVTHLEVLATLFSYNGSVQTTLDYSGQDFWTLDSWKAIGMINVHTGAQRGVSGSYGVVPYNGRAYGYAANVTNDEAAADLAWIQEQLQINIASGAMIPAPSTIRTIPGVEAPTATPVGSPLEEHPATTEDALFVPWADSITTPGALPTASPIATEVPSPETERTKTKVATAVQNLKVRAAVRAPFAYGALFRAPEAGGVSDDPMRWQLPLGGGIEGTEQYYVVTADIDPVSWSEPFQEYRWVFEGALYIICLIGLWVVLKPRINV